MDAEMNALKEAIGVEERGYYTNEEHDWIEGLLFRFLICRETLWEMVDHHRQYETRFADEGRRTRAFLIGFAAATELYFYSGKLIEAWLDRPHVVRKLNEGFYLSEIPEGTYDRVFESLTKPENIQAIRAAWIIFAEEIVEAESNLSRLAREEAAYGRLVSEIGRLHPQADARVDRILEVRSLLIPELRNTLRHTEIVRMAQSARRAAGGAIYAIRGLTMTSVSRLKKPGAAPIEFAPAQIEAMREMLEPGDILLTYSEGYMSNLFLPGSFKHGITYVGPPERRKTLGLERTIEGRNEAARDRFLRALETGRLPDGSDAELIEALAEGVIFNSLDNLLTARVNRMLVLRPKLEPEERTANLTTVFSLLGQGYDFTFDFNNATNICCTEVIYRALNGRGAIKLDLTYRMGRPTLSADDIALYALGPGRPSFDFVALAVPDPAERGRRPELVVGDEIIERLREIMRQ
jgi:hypothetical protein